jgi:hypothetical protein
VQTAFAIQNVNALAELAAPGSISLTVDFQVCGISPAHVAGLAATTDYWATTRTVPAVFQGHRSAVSVIPLAVPAVARAASSPLCWITQSSACASALRPRRPRTIR